MQNTPRVENLLGKKCQKIPNLLPPQMVTRCLTSVCLWGGGVQFFCWTSGLIISIYPHPSHGITNNNRKTSVNVVTLVNRFKPQV